MLRGEYKTVFGSDKVFNASLTGTLKVPGLTSTCCQIQHNLGSPFISVNFIKMYHVSFLTPNAQNGQNCIKIDFAHNAILQNGTF